LQRQSGIVAKLSNAGWPQIAVFDSLEPRKNQSEDDTFSTLNNDGQVYFEGDEKHLVY
jgi:hypothetical protein